MPVRGIGEFVPRAHGKAIVTAIDAIAEGFAKLLRDRPLMLDREIGDAPPRIELIGLGKGIGGAGILACPAISAAIRVDRIGRKLQRGINRPQEHPAAVGAADEIGVLALPPDPRRLAQRLFHHRGGVDEHLELACGRTRDQPPGQRLQRLLYHVMVIAPLRIDGDARLFRIARQGQRIDIGRIAHAERDDAARFRPQALRRSALRLAAFHPFHRAMPPIAQPAFEPLAAQRVGARPGKTAGDEAQPRRFFAQFGLKVCDFVHLRQNLLLLPFMRGG